MADLKEHADGIHFGLSEDDYHADPALGSSDIRNLIMSPLQYWANSYMNPFRLPEEPTEATEFGKLVHEAIFEPEKRTFIAKPEGMSFATKAGKNWRSTQIGQGKTILTIKQASALGMIVRACEASGIREAVKGSIAEVSYFWTDPSGHRCKIRMDAMKATAGFDLKTYANTMNKDLDTCLAHAVATHRYNVSAVWYRTGIDHMRDLIAKAGEGAIASDATDAQVETVTGIQPPDRHYPYWYLFFEKGGVPNVTVREFTPRNAGEINEYWRAGRSRIEEATSIFARNMERFGTDEMWIGDVPWKPFDDLDFTAARWILE